ncbi:MAG: hypothetical protein GY906_04655 [bacterium]|nr:hypothetical protein [bacterium]
MENRNTRRSLNRTFYSISRRYGEPIDIYKVLDRSVDYTTGNKTEQYETANIRNAVPVPTQIGRDVTYTPAMMQSVRKFAWQGGAGLEKEATTFLIAERDIPTWLRIEPTQFVIWRETTYQVVSIIDFDGGYIVNCEVAKGSGPTP